MSDQNPQTKPLRDFLGQEVKVGDCVAYAGTELTRDEFPMLAVGEIVGIKEMSAICTFDIKVLKVSGEHPPEHLQTGSDFRSCCMLEFEPEKKYYRPSQFFIKIPRPEGL